MTCIPQKGEAGAQVCLGAQRHPRKPSPCHPSPDNSLSTDITKGLLHGGAGLTLACGRDQDSLAVAPWSSQLKGANF